jgi:Cys-tRNA(Pro)/Cys-tRNA(Cys) deacylase
MSKGTRAVLALNRIGVKFTLHRCELGAEGTTLQAAKAIGIEPRRLLKTLMAEVDGRAVCVVIPSDRQVSMRKLAVAFHGKTARMMPRADVERVTGYRIGAVSPFALRKPVPVVIDEAVMTESTVLLNGGRSGLEIELSPGDARNALDALVRPLTG